MINANKAKQDREVTDDVREKPATIVPFAPMPKGQVEGNIVADFPLCNKSFNCAYSGHDL